MSHIDETLFGKGSTAKAARSGHIAGATAVRASTGVITLDELRNIRGAAVKNSKNDAVVISKAELDRIKDATTVKTKDQVIVEKKLAEEQKQAALAKSKAKKAKMM
jgi:hypothetical protein